MSRGPDAERAAQELIELAPRISRIASLFAEARFVELGISMPQYRALRAARRQPRRMSELAGMLLLSKQTVSQTVDVLVRQGMATRSEDHTDRRHTIVSTTQLGVRRLEAFEHAFADYLAGVLDGLPAEAQTKVADALEGLNALLNKRRDEGYFRKLRRLGEDKLG